MPAPRHPRQPATSLARVGAPWLIAALMAAGCSPGEGSGGADLAEVCAESDLIAQCPPGSSPVLGATGESICGGAAGGDFTNAEGAVSGRCFGSAGCVVACQFEAPCRCGVLSVLREDGVQCFPCEGFAACGDNVCEGGENPTSCPQDCAAECEPSAQRCSGTLLEICNLRGRWEQLPCPTGEVCFEQAGGGLFCRRDDVLVGTDAGMQPDSGPLPSGRLLEGPARYPGSEATARTGAGRDLAAIGGFTIDPFGELWGAVGAEFIGGTWAFSEDGAALIVVGSGGSARFAYDGGPLPPPEAWEVVPFDEAVTGVDGRAAEFSEDASALVLHGRVIGAGELEVPFWRVERASGAATRLGDSGAYSIPFQAVTMRSDGGAVAAIPVLDYTSRSGVVYGNGHLLQVWEGEDAWSLAVDEGAATDVRFSPDGRLVAVTRMDLEFRDMPWVWAAVDLYSVADRERIHSILAAEDAVPLTQGLIFSPRGDELAIASSGIGARAPVFVELWNIADGVMSRSLPVSERILDLAYSPDGTTLAVLGRTSLELFDVDSGVRLPLPPNETGLETGGERLAYSLDGTRLVVWTDQQVVVYATQ